MRNLSTIQRLAVCNDFEIIRRKNETIRIDLVTIFQDSETGLKGFGNDLRNGGQSTTIV